MTSRILVVDDEPAVRFALVELLEDHGHEVVAVESGDAALEHLLDVDVVVTDLAMPGLDGLGVVREAHRRAPGLPVIVLTARGSEKSAVQAMKAGAEDYLTKPFDVDEVALTVARAAEAVRVRREVMRGAAERISGRAMLGDGPAMRALRARIARIAPRDVTVIVRGETGTGKELVASLLHALGPRATGPLVRFNCAAVPAELADAELFGHARGAFTGAIDAKPGYFVRASGGTLVLDEIGELPLGIQAKLLRAVQDGEVQPVGGEPRRVDVRLIACTHRDLGAEVRAGRFREDLYFRLAVITIELPPLRERLEDIPQLVEHFLTEFVAPGAPLPAVKSESMDYLKAQGWKGNIRELRNVVQRAVVLSGGGAIELAHLQRPGRPAGASGAVTLPRVACAGTALEQAEARTIQEALARNHGNKSRTARELGIALATLKRRCKDYGLGGASSEDDA